MRMSVQRRSLNGRTSLNNSSVRDAPHGPNVVSTRTISAPSQSYDIITGEPLPQIERQGLAPAQTQVHPLRRSHSRTSMLPRPEQPVAVITQQKYQDDLHALQVRLNKLEYELQNRDSEREMIALQYKKEKRELEVRAEADYRKYQEAETERLRAVRERDTALQEVQDLRDNGVSNRTGAEQRLRQLEKQNEILLGEKEDLEARLSDAEAERRRIIIEEVEGRRSRLEQTLEEAKYDLAELRDRLDDTTAQLTQKHKDVETLEQTVLALRDQVGGGEELDIIRRELGEQMAYVRRLETTNREQTAEIRKLREERRNVGIVNEEKKALEMQVRILKDAERRVTELEIQKEMLEDERRTWTTILDQANEGDQREFDTPESVVKALLDTRIEHTLILERNGVLENELISREDALRALEADRDSLRAELTTLEQAAAAGDESGDLKALRRSERQRQLGQKEVDYLKAQLEAFNAEETTLMENSSFDAQRAEQLKALEGLLEQYKLEIAGLHAEIAKLESPAPSETRGTKRPASDLDFDQDSSSQTGHLLRKNKNLQIALQKTTHQSQMLAKELQATRTQLSALRDSNKTRILQLVDNPTAQHEAVKMSTLRILKQQNQELMTQLRGDENELSRVEMVPASSLEALKLELRDKDVVIADREKTNRRQREIWTLKAAEFRDSISSILGYTITFSPNGKVKVTSQYYRGPARPPVDDGEREVEEDREDYIEFDGDKGTMKIGGGAASVFGESISELVDLWVRQRREIPCLLAAMTLKFYDDYGGSVPPAVDSDNGD